MIEISNEEVMQRAAEIQRERNRAYHEEIVTREREAHQQQENEERAFAAELGVTWEQFQEIADYISDKVYKEQQ